jgi:hypothetical protein
MKKFFVLSAALVMTVGLFAQGNPSASASATASANIIQPIEIVKTAEIPTAKCLLIHPNKPKRGAAAPNNERSLHLEGDQSDSG